MSTRYEQFDKARAKRGWTYDAGGDKVFREGVRVLDAAELIALVPEMALDELASWEDQQGDRF